MRGRGCLGLARVTYLVTLRVDRVGRGWIESKGEKQIWGERESAPLPGGPFRKDAPIPLFFYLELYRTGLKEETRQQPGPGEKWRRKRPQKGPGRRRRVDELLLHHRFPRASQWCVLNQRHT